MGKKARIEVRGPATSGAAKVKFIKKKTSKVARAAVKDTLLHGL